MQRPTDNLRADHVLTGRAARVLRHIADAVRAGDEFPAEDCAVLLRFQREYVLAVHMRQENELLCPAVAMRGDEQDAMVVGELLRLHEEIAELTHSLVMFWEPVGELTQPERAGFSDTVHALLARLRRREQLEEQSLFPACDAVVPADDQLDWVRFADELAAGRKARAWTNRIDALVAKYGV